MKFEYDTYTLSNGKSFDANNGILGLGENITIYEGYDGEVCESFSREEPPRDRRIYDRQVE